jgi:hypothetical protein
MVVKIPADKLCKLKAGIQSIVKVKKIKLKDIESVVGLMAFCARAIPSARAQVYISSRISKQLKSITGPPKLVRQVTFPIKSI